MTSEPARLRDGSGPARKLLRAAELDRPSHAARRHALAVASAVTTLGATSAVAAATTAAVTKGVLFWVCVGAAGGSTVALAVSELVAQAPSASPARRAASSPAVMAAAALPSSERVVPLLPEPSSTPPRLAPPIAPAGADQSPVAPTEPAPLGPPMASAASFGDDGKAKPTLFEELRLIEAARASVGRGAPSAALSVLDAYDQAYPGGQFRPEALALRIQALSLNGDKVRARALLIEFQRRYPRHPLMSRVASSVGDQGVVRQ